ncbi:MAG: nuclear transport factor 2 family protein [Leucobacter sp.]
MTAAEIDWLIARARIEDVLSRFIYSLDRLRWKDLETTLVPDFRYGFKNPDDTAWVWFTGVDEMVRRLGLVTEHTVVSQHFCPNPLVEVSGNEATALINHLAYVWWRQEEGTPPELHTVAARWEAELECLEGAWRIRAMVFDPTFLIPWEDDPSVFPPRGPVLGTAWDSELRNRSTVI